MLLLYFHYTDNSYDRDDIPLSNLVLKCKAEAYEEEENLEDEQEEDEEYNIATDDEGMCMLGCRGNRTDEVQTGCRGNRTDEVQTLQCTYQKDKVSTYLR